MHLVFYEKWSLIRKLVSSGRAGFINIYYFDFFVLRGRTNCVALSYWCLLMSELHKVQDRIRVHLTRLLGVLHDGSRP